MTGLVERVAERVMDTLSERFELDELSPNALHDLSEAITDTIDEALATHTDAAVGDVERVWQRLVDTTAPARRSGHLTGLDHMALITKEELAAALSPVRTDDDERVTLGHISVEERMDDLAMRRAAVSDSPPPASDDTSPAS